MNACSVYMTVGSVDEARAIAADLVERRLAACVNLVPGIRSIYRWRGEVADDEEVAMFAKTRTDLVDALTERVKALHSYSCPCIVALPIGGGNADFLDWIAAETRPADTGAEAGGGRMRLFSGPLSMFGAKAQIAALEKGLDFELTLVPFDMTELYTPKHPEVLRINPKGQVPVLIHGALEIFDSTQIFEYLEDLKPEPHLWPPDPAARAMARLLEHKSDDIFFPNIIRLMGLQETPDDPIAVAARHAAAVYHRELEDLLVDRQFLAGPYSFADIAFYMAQLFGERMGATMTDATPRLLRWRDRMTSRPAVAEVVAPMACYLLSKGRPLPAFLSAMRRS